MSTRPPLHPKSLLSLIRPGSLPTGLVVLAGALFSIGVGAAQWLVGPDLSLVVFYVLPVVAVTWLCRVRIGVYLAVVVTLESLLIAELEPINRAHGVILWNTIVPLGFYLLVVWLVAGQRKLLDDQAHLASTDALTGTLNRRAFYERVEIELERSRRHHEPVAFVYLDVDRLKQVNDDTGHGAGDALLRRFAGLVTASLRVTDLFGRVGGDEFAVFLPGAGPAEAADVADRILHRLRTAPGAPSTASIGVVWCRRAPRDIDAVVQRADELMYEAKQQGGAAVCVAEQVRLDFTHPAGRSIVRAPIHP